MRQMKVLMVIALALTLGACTRTMGVDPAALQPGMTYAEIVARYGPPQAETTLQNGDRGVVYQYARGSFGGGEGNLVGLIFRATARLSGSRTAHIPSNRNEFVINVKE